ncbi:MAG: hypothetical protein A3D87_00430 [Omnitrophica WOR_2 bacterium RIFCSPHIGHO2_02_FULL_50_17]|nr:MAG: hypothetical protein A3D87_00430 [Omnitrophica WOR_2 bacterium RIFCSPHIGHO2_02_FULL_50_17]
MDIGSFEILEKKVIIRLQNRVCETADELLSSALFKEILLRGISVLKERGSRLLKIFGKDEMDESGVDLLIQTLKFLTKMRRDLVVKVVRGSEVFFRDPDLFNDFVEYVYNYWRSFDRFVICDSQGSDLDKRPYRTFHTTIEQITHLVRGIYRDVQENITGNHPRVYRQVGAGAEISAISIMRDIPFPTKVYEKLNGIPIIRQVLLYPPLILDPPMNKRRGRFTRVPENPLEAVHIDKGEWLCYPAKVGQLIVLIYFQKKFFELGFSLCNLFQLAEDEDLQHKPDAVYAFGVTDNQLDHFGDFPTVFYDDTANDMLVGAVPNRDEFGYFGYLKKMVLTLHNIKVLKKGNLPFHGALVKIILKGSREATLLFFGDTGAGKSETLEALRELGYKHIQDVIVIADDMGSLHINPAGEIIGYGTEIGAFLRLDDLQPGYAFGQIDRAIIMSPNKINARIVLPVTTYENVMKGHKVDFILYANNYEDIDEEHSIIERFSSAGEALKVFREGAVMSKGTTTSQGIVHSYFANIFGPPQYKELHDPLAEKYFNTFFDAGLWVGQMRTRLGLPGWERKGPEESARELLRIIQNNWRDAGRNR